MTSWLLAASLSALVRAEPAQELHVPEISVLGTQGSSLDAVPTVGVIEGRRLERKRQSTIGETLSREAGVTSSQFGPNASRPVIRGLEGDRVRVLQNGVGVLDASAASPDHAVAADPLIVERFEIVRGPAALLYGSNAIGGVVNIVTNRIPSQKPEAVTGRVDTRFSSADLGRSGGLTVDFPAAANWGVHIDGAARGADDYRVPGYARTEAERREDRLDPEEKGRVYNTFNRSFTQAAGTSYFFPSGYVGTAFSLYESTYGSPPKRDVHINLSQQRWDVAGEWRGAGLIKSVQVKNSYSNYKHDEMEGGSLGTTFKNFGDEARAEIRHQPLLGMEGVIGLQANMFRLSAQGEEAFLPTTDNQTYSGFVFQELKQGRLRPSFGARLDQASVASHSHDRFGPGLRKVFSGGSFSLGLAWQLTDTQSLVLNGALTERAPNYQELFANGPHAATSVFERGDTSLGKEVGQSAELSWRHKGESGQGRVSVFVQDFRGYIALSPTELPADPDSGFDVYQYRSTEARLWGAELEYRLNLGTFIPGGVTELEFKADALRGLDRKTGNHLPRITPVRESIALVYKSSAWQSDLEIERSERQSLTAPGEDPTSAYTLVNAGVEKSWPWGRSTLSASARVNNVFDVEARQHVSLKKSVAPLPGRSFIAGVQATF